MVKRLPRETRQTELGEEIKCSKCEDFWPNDAEFFYMSKGAPHSWCKACYLASDAQQAKKERWVAKQREARAQARA